MRVTETKLLIKWVLVARTMIIWIVGEEGFNELINFFLVFDQERILNKGKGQSLDVDEVGWQHT